jgi:EmrB/QacA subfamily drug resistance transporter
MKFVNGGNKVLTLLSLVALLVNYVETMVVPALPTIQNDFNTTESVIAWVTSSYIIVGGVSSLLFGKLGDVYGRRKMYLLAMLSYMIAVGIAGFSPNVYFLIASRAIQGLGMAMFPIGLAIITDIFPPSKVAFAQGILSSTFGIGTALGLILGSYIDQILGWQFAFHIAFVLSLILIVLSARVLGRGEVRRKEVIDYFGIATLTIGVTLILIYITEIPYLGWGSFGEILILLTGIALIISFVPIEMRSKEPLISLGLMRIRNFLVANLLGLTSSIALLILFFSVVYYSQLPEPYGLGLDIISAGLTFAPATSVMLIVGPIVGNLTPRLGPKPLLITGSIISMLGFSTFIFNRSTPFDLSLDAFIVGIGIISVIIPIVNMVAVSTPQDKRALSLGVNTLLRNIGSAIGPVIASTYMTSFKEPYLIYFDGKILGVVFFPSGLSFNLIFITSIILMFLTMIIAMFTKNYRFK